MLRRSSLLVVSAFIVVLDARAQSAPAAAPPAPAEPTNIEDNSFLVEEAFNQERGVVQHISTFSVPRGGGPWVYTFTQEWPVGGLTHQLSYTLPVQAHEARSGAGLGDVALNYRYQLADGAGTRLLVAPRATLLLPTGRVRDGEGAGALGVQVNLPASYLVARRLIVHTNLGATLTPSARGANGGRATTRGFNAGQSAIWLLHPKFNAMLELAWTTSEQVVGPGARERSEQLLLAPGLRGAIDLPSGLQIVPGVAVPIGVGPSRGERDVFVYLSLEHAFVK